MNTTPRNLPRFVPTLTEIVEPSSLTRISTTTSTSPDLDAMAQSVMQRVEQALDLRLREGADALLRNLVAEQLATLRLRLRQELAMMVRDAVVEVIALRHDDHK